MFFRPIVAVAKRNLRQSPQGLIPQSDLQVVIPLQRTAFQEEVNVLA